MFKEIDYNKHFVIGTPLVGWKCDRGEHMAWLRDANDVLSKFPNAKYFAAFELDHRGLEPFQDVIKRLEELNGDYWTYSINDKESKVTFSNRWIRIETGRNLVRDFAQRLRRIGGNHWGEDTWKDNLGVVNNDAVLYIDSDMYLSSLVVEKMFEIDRALVSVNVPAYGLSGKVVNEDPRIEEHWNTAGMLLVNAPAYYDLPWYHNSYLNLSDDPTFQYLAERLPWGQTWVRKDINAEHMGQLVEVEARQIQDRVI
jgi:hypothetical protein